MEHQHVFSGRYRVLDVLGEGGMARVYKALDERLRRLVAVKTLLGPCNHQPQLVARFEREARLAARLSHPNIIGIYDIAHDEDGAHYIVMELVEGDNLKTLIGREAPFGLLQTMDICRQLCLAQDYAHSHGVIHRDIKPANVFLTPSRQVKVGDFGIARALDSGGLTSSGMVVGSASYMSPEQAQGQPATARSDLYSTGVILYEMLAGRLPFAADTPLEMAAQHVTSQPPPPSQFNPRLAPSIDRVVLKAIAKDPAQRYQSGAALAAALAEAGRETAGLPDPVARPAARRSYGPGGARVQRPAILAAGPGVAAGAWRPAFGGTRPSFPAAGGLRPRPAPTEAFPAHGWRRRLAVSLLVALVLTGALTGAVAVSRGGLPAAIGGHVALRVGAGRRHARPAAAAPRPGATTRQVGHPARHAGSATGRAAPTRTPTAPAAPTVRPTAAVAAPTAPAAAPSPQAAVSAARRRSPVRTPRAVPGSVGHVQATLVIAQRVTYGFMPIHPTTHFDTSAAFALAVAHWRGAGPGDTITLRWATPAGGRGTYRVHYTVGGRAYVAIRLLAAGVYSVGLYADSTEVAAQRFTVTAGRALPVATPAVLPAPAVATPGTVAPSGESGGASAASPRDVGAEAMAAVEYANDVYMQVMNRRDTSGVSAVFGPGLAAVNRAVAAELLARHEHWQITLGAMTFPDVTVLGPDLVRVGVVKTESAALYTDTGRLIRDAGTSTIRLIDIVQRIGGRWLVVAVYH